MDFLAEFAKARLYPPADTHPSFAGKTVIVTGANTGVGYEAALKFAQQGASPLILAVRSLKKGEEARARIQSRIGSTTKTPEADTIDVWELDMLSYPSIQAFAARASRELRSLDYLILNAGVSPAKFERSAYGWERTEQVNVLSTVLLALLLLPQLRASKTSEFTPVLELVSSGIAYAYNDLMDYSTQQGPMHAYSDALEKSWNPMSAYGVSKVFLEFAKVELTALATKPSKSGKDDGVLVISVCPGPTKSDLARDQTAWYMRIALAIFGFFQRSGEQGSRTYISGVMQGEKGQGGFWQHDKLRAPAPLLLSDRDGKLRAQIWAEIVQALESEVPEVKQLVQG
ncbi:hypothetical protein LTR53_009206 [Teratosphaeriaceae sp. CCFEE 6253]|nr:hypothetical protein LTR53_009206 [Teratosphaeriaceae sp. CCFEE 6253]